MKTIFFVMKKVLSLTLSIALVVSMLAMPVKKVQAATTSFDLTAQELVDRMGVGWNLGNSLDSAMSYNGGETSWGNPYITKAMIDEIKRAGFKTIRIPTTWTYKTSGAPDYTINSAWMDRVEEVVNYALDNDMYVILNTHHEGGNIIPTYAKQDQCSDMLTKIWTQIAQRFEKYGGNLIFEVLNEPRVEGGENEWNGGTAEVRDVLNTYNQTCLDAIRATGGNNSLRKVMIPTVAASLAESTLTALKIPNDNNVIVSVHAYSPYNFAMEYPGTSTWGSDSDKGSLDWQMQHLYDLFVSKGVPVIIGEFGSTNKNNISDRITHASYYVQAARKKGITCVWWDNNNNGVGSETFGIFNRSNLTWNYPELVSAMIASEAAVAGDYDDSSNNGTLSSNWTLYDNNGTASKDSTNVVRISSIGAENWQPHYYQEGIKIEKDTPMVFTGTFTSSIDREITVQLELPEEDYQSLAVQTIALKANQPQKVKLYIPSQSEEKNNVKVTICMGAINGVTAYPEHTVEVKDTSLNKVVAVPGTVPVDAYSDKTSSITFTTENGVIYAGNLGDASYLDYQIYVPEAGKYTVGLKLAAGDAQWNADNMIVKVDDVTVATVPIRPSSSWTTFTDHNTQVEFAEAGVYKVSVVSEGGACNVSDFTFTKIVPSEESTTQEETTTPEEVTTPSVPDVTIHGGVEINGYQISTSIGGIRTVYSVENKIDGKDVVGRGIVYSLSNYVSKDEIFIGSTNPYVKAFAGTNEIGKHFVNFSDSPTATSYAMTMVFSAKTASEYQAKWSIRAYALLSDGTYVYSDVASYTIYDISRKLYDNRMMNSWDAHNYLYTNILTVVDANYREQDFEWSNIIVGSIN